jgi:hypothetical protein
MSDTNTLLDNILAGNFTAAGADFNDLMAGRMTDALDTQKEAIAAEIYNENAENGYKVKQVDDKYHVVDAKTGEMYDGEHSYDSAEAAEAAIFKMSEGSSMMAGTMKKPMMAGTMKKPMMASKMKMSNEDAQIDEVSGSTLGSYMVKSRKSKAAAEKDRDVASHGEMGNAKYRSARKKVDNRNRGMNRANDKLQGSGFSKVHAT